ncbi:MAG: protein kinase domain-containing protein [Mycobacteriales bacterium]
MTAAAAGVPEGVRLLLQTVWDLLAAGDHWPTYTEVDRALHRDHRLDVDVLIEQTPVGLLAGGRPHGGARPHPEEPLSLTVDGAVLCAGPGPALEILARTAGLAAAAEAAAQGRDAATVEFDEATAGQLVPDAARVAVARASGLLLHSEPWSGHVTLWEGGWRMDVTRAARPFAGVDDIGTFLAARPAPAQASGQHAGGSASASSGSSEPVGAGDELVLAQRWRLGDPLRRGGFGQVFRAVGEDGREAAVKLVPKEPGADRELLFVGLDGVRNVMPVWDSGETDDSVVIVMPLADESLPDLLDRHAGPLPAAKAVGILRDVAAALEDLAGTVVHRDIKPDNVLLLDGSWCLTDFGISRYTAASTSPDTHKYAWTSEYAAPEQWTFERATPAADVYAVGVMAHEMLAGAVPFPGPYDEDLREQHLHTPPPRLPADVPARLAALIAECLAKPPQARPPAAQLANRLARAAEPPRSPGASALADPYRDHATAAAAASAQASAEQTEQQRRGAMHAAASASLAQISAELLDTAVAHAPTADIRRRPDGGWTLGLGPAKLGLSAPDPHDGQSWGGWQPPAFDVIAHAVVSIVTPPDRSGYEGRSHSLWFCDARTADEYAWHETAFMVSPLIPQHGRQDPFARPPGEESAKAVWAGMAELQVAWPFTPLVVGDLDEFIDRWIGWFAQAVRGDLRRPTTMPEGNPENTWRR